MYCIFYCIQYDLDRAQVEKFRLPSCLSSFLSFLPPCSVICTDAAFYSNRDLHAVYFTVVVTCLIPVVIYVAFVVMERYHLFVWTVFLPKLLYMGLDLVIYHFLSLMLVLKCMLSKWCYHKSMEPKWCLCQNITSPNSLQATWYLYWDTGEIHLCTHVNIINGGILL